MRPGDYGDPGSSPRAAPPPKRKSITDDLAELKAEARRNQRRLVGRTGSGSGSTADAGTVTYSETGSWSPVELEDLPAGIYMFNAEYLARGTWAADVRGQARVGGGIGPVVNGPTSSLYPGPDTATEWDFTLVCSGIAVLDTPGPLTAEVTLGSTSDTPDTPDFVQFTLTATRLPLP